MGRYRGGNKMKKHKREEDNIDLLDVALTIIIGSFLFLLAFMSFGA